MIFIQKRDLGDVVGGSAKAPAFCSAESQFLLGREKRTKLSAVMYVGGSPASEMPRLLPISKSVAELEERYKLQN